MNTSLAEKVAAAKPKKTAVSKNSWTKYREPFQDLLAKNYTMAEAARFIGNHEKWSQTMIQKFYRAAKNWNLSK